MKRNLQRSLSIIFCATLLFSSLGCPFEESAEADFDEIEYDFDFNMKGFCLYWFQDVATLNPRDINVTAPPRLRRLRIWTYRPVRDKHRSGWPR